MDPQTEHARVREDWTGRAVQWGRRADEVAEIAAKLNRPLIDRADIKSGQRVLDLATGPGEPALTVARLVGPRGTVSARDLVPDMLASAERRATQAGIANMDFKVADMVDLPDPDASFDRTICRFGLMFVADPRAAARETLRVLKPGGRAAYLVWGPRQDNTMMTVFAASAHELFGPDDPLIDLETPFRLSGAGELGAALEAAGFEGVVEEELRLEPKVPEGTRFWAAQADMAVGRRLDAASEAERAAFEAAVSRRFAECVEDGFYRLKSVLRVASGIRPGG